MTELVDVVDRTGDPSIMSLAASWQKATSNITYSPLSQSELRQRFESLVLDLLAILNAESPPDEVIRHGRDAGRWLVEMNLLKPEILERSLTFLSSELSSVGTPERLGWYMAGIAGGFAGATENALLAQQEAVRQAATVALRQAQNNLSAEINERTRAEAMQRELAERLKRLREIDLAILSAESLQGIVDISIDHLQHLIPAVSIAIAVFDIANKRSIILSSTHKSYPAGRDMQITMVDALNRLGAGDIVYVEDLQAIRHISEGVAEIADLGGRSLMAIPLRSKTELIGGLMVTLGEVRPFTDTEIAVARELADSVAVAIQNRRLLEAEKIAREREKTLREVAAALTVGLDLKELLEHILERLGLVIPNHSSAIILLEENKPVLTATSGVPSIPEQLNSLIASRPLALWTVLETGRPHIINDTHASPAWEIVPGMEYIRAWMGVPLSVKGESIGILTIDRDQPDAFTQRDKELALAFADQVAIGIDNAHLFARQQAHAGELERNVREATRDLQVLYGIAATAVGKPDIDGLLQRSLTLTAGAFGCAAAVVHLLEGQDETLRLAAKLENGDPALQSLLAGFDIHSPVLVESLNAGRPMKYNDDSLPEAWSGQKGRVLAVVPLRARGRNLGVLSLLGDNPDDLSGVPPDLLTTIGDLIGAVVENIKFYQLARQSAILEERERLARDIHDQVTQSLYSAALFAEAARGAAEVGNLDKVRQHTGMSLRMTNQALRELRLLLFEFRTEALARKGLVEALRERLKKVENRAGISGEVHADDIGNLPVAIEETFYRIALEALNNALRHSRADQVDIVLMSEDGDLTMTLVDNGIGFDREAAAASGGMGLEGMQKRIGKVGGVLTISSDPDGTWVTARAPLVGETE